MKKFLLTGTVILGTFLTACAGGGAVVVRYGPPPPPRYGVVGFAPGPGYIWTDGYWDRRGSQWVWIGGRWLRPPRPHAVWVAGGWRQERRGWRFHRGYWR
jgi:YXWGXW repeat-containing protein